MKTAPNILIFLAALSLLNTLYAENFVEASVTKIQRQVEVFDINQKIAHPAALNEIITGQHGIRTGTQSRAELLFNDRTLARIGANSLFTFKEGQREVMLNKGTMLFQVPKNKGEMKITTASVTAAITGTTGFVETNSRSYSKVVILEGTARIFLNNRLGESTLLDAGKMLILPPNARVIPEPVDVDIKTIVRTSGLIQNMPQQEEPPQSPDGSPSPTGNPPPPSPTDNPTGLRMEQLNDAMAKQGDLINKGVLGRTPIYLPGEGPDTIIDPTNDPTQPPNPDVLPPPDVLDPLEKSPPLKTMLTGDSPFVINNTVAFNLNIPTLDKGAQHYVGGFYKSTKDDPSLSTYFFGGTTGFDKNSQFDIDIRSPDPRVLPIAAYKFPSLSINGFPSTVIGGNAYGTAFISEQDLNIGALTNANVLNTHLAFAAKDGDMTIGSGVSYNAVGKSMLFHARGGLSGNGTISFNRSINNLQDIKINGQKGVHFSLCTIQANGTPDAQLENAVDIYSEGLNTTGNNSGITIDQTSLIAGSDASNKEGHINIRNNRADASATVISITNSSVLRALAGASQTGSLKVIAEGGGISIKDSFLYANTGSNGNSTLEIKNNGSNGQIAITNSALSAQILKIGAIGADGTVTINTSAQALNASNIMKIYGGSGTNGKVLFTGTNTINGDAVKHIAAYTVEVASSGSLSVIDGAVHIYANQHNYNCGDLGVSASGYGTVTVSSAPGSTAGTLSSAPPF